MNTQLSSIRSTTHNSINGILFSDIKTEIGHSDSFIKLEEIRKNILKKIDNRVEALLCEAFNDSKEKYEKQAVIEAAQELGHIELAIEMMGIL
ncbi:hypothetical protein [Pedobacter panaciterrae]